MKVTKTYEETICDICGVEGSCRTCSVCKKDICKECWVSLEMRKPTKWFSKIDRETHSVFFPRSGIVMCPEHLPKEL